jgi:hypothetical protein
MNAYFDGKSIVINQLLAEDPSVPLREYNHHILGTREHAWIGTYAAIESALADYFACSFLENPRLGEKSAKYFDAKKGYIRNLDNERTFQEFRRLAEDRMPYDGAEIWGGAFWKLRQQLGPELVNDALASAWLKLNLPAKDEQVAHAFLQNLLNEIKAKAPAAGTDDMARKLLKERDFPT